MVRVVQQPSDRQGLGQTEIQASEHDDGVAATSPPVIRAGITQPTLISISTNPDTHHPSIPVQVWKYLVQVVDEIQERKVD
jgi:hypothetical protein